MLSSFLLEGGAVGGLAAAILGAVPVGFIIAGTAAVTPDNCISSTG